MTSRVLISPKGLAEVRTEVLDFSPLLLVGQTVTGVAVSCSVYSGTDAAPAAVASVTLNGTAGANLKLTGGVLGVIYQIRVDGTTTNPVGVLSLSLFLAVIPDLP